MKRIINGKRYDTRTATRICTLPCSAEFCTDFEWHATDLYRSPGGTFFIAGEGNAMSLWAQASGQNGYIGGSGLRLATEEEAQEFAEAAGLAPDAYEEAFGVAPLG